MNSGNTYKNDLQRRLFEFAVEIIRLIRKLPKSKEFDIISRQLIKSATSAGANYEEAQAAVSKADFSNKIGISLKEIRETVYWIRLVIEITDINKDWIAAQTEAEELKKILGTIYTKLTLKNKKD